jgi:glycosyltransferase involved in cell wall biosynthesis
VIRLPFLNSFSGATVAFNMRPQRGPFGGGNQWLRQVSAYLKRCGYDTRFDRAEGVDLVLGTHAGLSGGLSISYDDVLRAKERNPRLLCVQRINDNDVRKGTGEMDRFLAQCNRAADHTVFVSEWLRDYHAERWFDRTRPHSVIPNGADPAIFHPFGNRPWQPGQPLRFVTHHWSDNMSKGFDIYTEMDALIAGGRLPGVELWVVGRWPAQITWRAARTFAPCAGVALATILRQAHVGLTASRFEPGAMHPVEAMQCGLPLLYHPDTGGTVELGRNFGVLLEGDLVAAVERMKAEYGMLRERVLRAAPSGDVMCAHYRRLVQAMICQRP